MIRFYDGTDLGPTYSDVATTDVCPDCDGNGRVRRPVPRGPEPWEWVACPSCSGTGEVPADGVVHCSNPSCGVVCWADQVCTHTEDAALCHDCAPARCRACIDERSTR